MTTDQKHWMVIYTKPFWEKRVFRQLQDWYGIEAWCPLKKVQRQWSDRIKTLEEPFFRSYVFVRVTEKQRIQSLSVDGVLMYIHFERKPVRISDEVIDSVKKFLEDYNQAELRTIEPGLRITYSNGVFQNQEAVVAEVRGDEVILELPQLGCRLIASVKDIAVA